MSPLSWSPLGVLSRLHTGMPTHCGVPTGGVPTGTSQHGVRIRKASKAALRSSSASASTVPHAPTSDSDCISCVSGASPTLAQKDGHTPKAIAEALGHALALLYGGFETVRSIETPGGDDDRQWLIFWLALTILLFVERFLARVLLSTPSFVAVVLSLLGDEDPFTRRKALEEEMAKVKRQKAQAMRHRAAGRIQAAVRGMREARSHAAALAAEAD